jgi:hypothetical protein
MQRIGGGKRREEQGAGRFCRGESCVGAGGSGESEECVNAFVDQLLGIGGGLGRGIAVVQRLDFNLVAARAVFGIDGVKVDLCAIQVGQADLVCGACQRHGLAENDFFAALAALRPQRGARNRHTRRDTTEN